MQTTLSIAQVHGLLTRGLLTISQIIQTPFSMLLTFQAMKKSSSVTDLNTGARLLQGRCKGDLYEWPADKSQHRPSSPLAHFTTTSTPTLHLWHARLGHPQPRITKSFVSSFKIHVASSRDDSFTFCHSCLCNKSHRLPFGDNSICSSRPFEFLYSDVWGPSPIHSFDNF
uniref:Uncharacterized mitochondrial protein AtMg00300 n=1 Tax=Nicotiana tabacum TaxID=4097 RepID=A0A1S3YIX9_TOBAC|nr:PREDICTED: uncharacterized mitochondrial protein AtMg00300-like [Nicotiana tabacum]